MQHSLRVPQYTIAGACAGGNQAIGQAFSAIRSGALSWAMAGGCEGVITPITFSGFEAMRALSTTVDGQPTPRPFDKNRNGMIVGEGAAIFILDTRRKKYFKRPTNSMVQSYL